MLSLVSIGFIGLKSTFPMHERTTEDTLALICSFILFVVSEIGKEFPLLKILIFP